MRENFRETILHHLSFKSGFKILINRLYIYTLQKVHCNLRLFYQLYLRFKQFILLRLIQIQFIIKLNLENVL